MTFLSVLNSAPILLTAIPTAGDQAPRSSIVPNVEAAQPFIQRYNPTHNIYFAAGRLRDGAVSRKKENIASIAWVWVDVDRKDHPGLAEQDFLEHVTTMVMPPTAIIDTGHGWHLWWVLNEPLSTETQEKSEAAEAVLRLACRHVGGDPACCDIARVMRFPGTLNVKNPADPKMAEILIDGDQNYDVDDLIAHWNSAPPEIAGADVDYIPEAPSLIPAPKTNGAAGPHTDFASQFGEFAHEHRDPIDVDARLAAMKYKGAGETGIHQTQLQCIASLLGRGMRLEDAVRKVTTATRTAVTGDPQCANWNWSEERERVFQLGIDLVAKDERLVDRLPDGIRQQWEQVLAEGKRPRFVGGPNAHVRGYGQKAAQNEHPRVGAIAHTATATASKLTVDGPTPYVAPDPTKIPRRAWLYGRHYLRGAVTATIGPGGRGKSSLSLVEAIAMASGEAPLGEMPSERLRVWYWSAEDDRHEIDRRVAAICKHHNINPDLLKGWLFIDSGHDMPVKLAAGTGNGKGPVFDKPSIQAIKDWVVKHNIDVSIWDPFVSLHAVNENDNMAIAAVLNTSFGDAAKETNCAFEVVHHTRKPGREQLEITVDDSRGGSAITNATRGVRRSLVKFAAPICTMLSAGGPV